MTPLVAVLAVAAAFAAGYGIAWLLGRSRIQVAEARRADALRLLSEQRADVANLQTAFRGLSAEILKESREEFLKQAEPKIALHIRPLEDALKRYDEAIRTIEGKRDEAYGGLKRQLEILSAYAHELKDETGGLKAALRSPTARGRWGEVALRRVVELAGMSEHCDFDEQTTAVNEEGRLRPDMVVRLPGGRTVIVDAKAPLDGYMRAVEAQTEKDRVAHIEAHARAVRDHMKRLSLKSYWEQFDSSTDLVVMFLPGESFAAAALEMDRDLFEDGMASRVILATPATLVALLRSFAMGWQQEQLAENAQKISEAGKELFDRFVTFTDHFDKIGVNLDKSIKAFNAAVRSMESRVLPGARRLRELGAARSPDAELPTPAPVETSPQQISPPDL